MSKETNEPTFTKKLRIFSEDDSIFQEAEDKGYSINELKGWLLGKEYDADLGNDVVFADFLGWKQSLKTLEIDESNFEEYFFDVRTNKPKLGQILACYESLADFVDGNLKRDIMHILMTSDKGGEAGPRLLQRLAGATEDTAFAVIKEMMADLLDGKSTEEVAETGYEFRCQYFFYTYRDCLPENDPHWWSTSLIDVSRLSDDELDEIVDRINDENSKEEQN